MNVVFKISLLCLLMATCALVLCDNPNQSNESILKAKGYEKEHGKEHGKGNQKGHGKGHEKKHGKGHKHRIKSYKIKNYVSSNVILSQQLSNTQQWYIGYKGNNKYIIKAAHGPYKGYYLSVHDLSPMIMKGKLIYTRGLILSKHKLFTSFWKFGLHKGKLHYIQLADDSKFTNWYLDFERKGSKKHKHNKKYKHKKDNDKEEHKPKGDELRRVSQRDEHPPKVPRPHKDKHSQDDPPKDHPPKKNHEINLRNVILSKNRKTLWNIDQALKDMKLYTLSPNKGSHKKCYLDYKKDAKGYHY